MIVVLVVGFAAVSQAWKLTTGSDLDGPTSGAFAEGGTAQNRLLKVTIAAIDDPFISPSPAIRPQTGDRFILIHLRIAVKLKHQQESDPNNFSLKTRDGHIYKLAREVAGNDLLAREAFFGRQSVGAVAFELPSDASVAELTFDAGFGESDLTWRAP